MSVAPGRARRRASRSTAIATLKSSLDFDKKAVWVAMGGLDRLDQYLQANASGFSQGRAATALLSEGYNLVYSICTEGESGTERAGAAPSAALDVTARDTSVVQYTNATSTPSRAPPPLHPRRHTVWSMRWELGSRMLRQINLPRIS